MNALTATDILFFSFSPSGIPTLHLAGNSDFVEMIRRFSRIPFNDREKRKLDNLQTLRTNYQKEGYNVDVHQLFHSWKFNGLQAKEEKLKALKDRLDNCNSKRSCWKNVKTVNNAEKIVEMEEKLRIALEGIRKRKNEVKGVDSMSIISSNYEIPVEHAYEPFDYIPEMLSGNNEDLLAYANILMSGN